MKLATRQKVSVGVYSTLRDRALADPECPRIRRERLTWNGHGATVSAFALMCQISAPTLRMAETEPERLTPRTRRKIAYVLEIPEEELFAS